MSSYGKPAVLLIVPAFNEAENLPRVLRDLQYECPGWDIVVIDDGSSDATTRIASCNGAAVLSLPFNLGIGGAVQAGFRYAVRRGYAICAQVDADGQHAAAETAHLVDQLIATGADVVIGSRFIRNQGFQSTALRRIGIGLIRLFIRVLTRQSLTDPTSGQRAFASRAMLILAEDYPQEYPEPEAIYHLARLGLRVVEVPVSMHARQGGRSSIRLFTSVLYVIKVILAILVRQTRSCTKEGRYDSLVPAGGGHLSVTAVPVLNFECAPEHADERAAVAPLAEFRGCIPAAEPVAAAADVGG